MNKKNKINSPEGEKWDLILYPTQGLFNFKFKEIWRFRDLLLLFVQRDLILAYKQTILGPIWHFFQPLLSALVFYVVFDNLIGVPTQGIPPILFYSSGMVLWGYFSTCVQATSSVFTTCANVYDQVYFPRLILPISTVIAHLVKIGIQLILIIVLCFWFYFDDKLLTPGPDLILLPVVFLILALQSLAAGIIISAFTARYRDLNVLINFGIQALMFLTPVVYPLSGVHGSYKWLIEINPLTPVLETFRFIMFSQGNLDLGALAYSLVFTLFMLCLGLIVFNRVERNFIDYA